MIRHKSLLIALCLLLILPACGQGQETPLPSNRNKILTGDEKNTTASRSTEESEPIAVTQPEDTTGITNTQEITTSASSTATTPTTVQTPAPTPKADDGIVIKSDNILSTQEKEALLKELEKELDDLFGAMNESPDDQEPIDEE